MCVCLCVCVCVCVCKNAHKDDTWIAWLSVFVFWLRKKDRQHNRKKYDEYLTQEQACVSWPKYLILIILLFPKPGIAVLSGAKIQKSIAYILSLNNYVVLILLKPPQNDAL